MQHFLVNSSLVRSADVQRDLERAAQAVKAKQAQRKSKGVDKKDKYWLKWGDAERRECVDIYVKRDMKGIQLHYGTLHPPPEPQSVPGERSLLKGLQSPILLGTPPSCELKKKRSCANTLMASAVRAGEGGSVDRETMSMLADTVAEKMCPHTPKHEHPYFSAEWAHKWLQKENHTWHKPTTERPPSTIGDLMLDNAWRDELERVIEDPRRFGIVMPARLVSLPKRAVVAADEIVLEYVPNLKGTFDPCGIESVHVTNSADKRQATGTPIFDMLGEMVSFQVLWRGLTKACHAQTGKIEHLLHNAIFQDHTANKVQTGESWRRCIEDLAERHQRRMVQYELPESCPVLLVTDKCPAHVRKDLYGAVEGVECSEHLLKMKDFNVYIFCGIPNRSHVTNAGDQLVNKSLRDCTRKETKRRNTAHALAIQDGRFPPGTAHDMSEYVMKPLLLVWISNWLRHPLLQHWVLMSWRRVMTRVPVAQFVDDIPAPAPNVPIPLPPPPSSLLQEIEPAPPSALEKAGQLEELVRQPWKLPAWKRTTRLPRLVAVNKATERTIARAMAQAKPAAQHAS